MSRYFSKKLEKKNLLFSLWISFLTHWLIRLYCLISSCEFSSFSFGVNSYFHSVWSENIFDMILTFIIKDLFCDYIYDISWKMCTIEKNVCSAAGKWNWVHSVYSVAQVLFSCWSSVWLFCKQLKVAHWNILLIFCCISIQLCQCFW